MNVCTNIEINSLKNVQKKVWKVELLRPFGTETLKICKKIKIQFLTKPGIYVKFINKESLYLKFERKNSINEVRNAKTKFDLLLAVK